MEEIKLENYEKALEQHKIEVAQLRFGVVLPGSDAMPSEVLSTLQIVRGNLDRIETILGEVASLKAATARQRGVAAATYDEVWAQNLSKQRNRPDMRGEFVGPRERYAQADLASFDARRTLNSAEHLYSVTDEAYDFIRLAHRGLDGVRQDLHQVLRAVSFESRMDR